MKDIGLKLRPGFRHFCLIVITLILAGCASRTPAPVVGPSGQATQTADKDMYTVKSGDTLYSIAREHNMDHRELIALNGIENPNQIAVGHTLRLRPQTSAGTMDTAGTGVVTQPIAIDQGVDRRPLTGGETSTTAPVTDSASATLKREPKAGKEPYSEQALAQAQQGPLVPRTTEPAPATTPPSPESKPPETSQPAADNKATTPPAGGQSWSWPASGQVLSNFGSSGNKGVDIAGQRGEAVIAAEGGRVILASNTLRGYGNMVIVKHSDTLISVYAHNSKLLVKEGEQVRKGQKIAEMGNSDADRVKLHFEVREQGKPVDPMKYLPTR